MATVLPSDKALEGMILGVAMTNSEAASDIAMNARAMDFHAPAHQLLFECIRDLVDRGAIVDSASVVAELRATGTIESIGGDAGDAVPYVRGLAMASPEAPNVDEYVSKLKALSLRRAMVTKATDALRRAVDLSSPAGELADDLAVGFSEIAVSGRTSESVSARDLAKSEFKELQRRMESKDFSVGMPTGFHDLDSILGGLEKSTLILVAARPSMGKTALAGCMATNVARTGSGVLLFSLEMSSGQLFRRMLASESRVSAKNLRIGKVSPDEMNRLAPAFAMLSELPVYIDQESGITELDIRSRARRHMARHGDLGLIIVDHIQLVRSSRREPTRDTEMGNVSGGLKRLAKELGVPVLALSQLSRRVEERSDKHPMLSDLRDSGNLEQDSDVVLGLYRDDYYHPNSQRKGELDIGVLKNREGETGMCTLRWNAKSVRFDSLSRAAQ